MKWHTFSQLHTMGVHVYCGSLIALKNIFRRIQHDNLNLCSTVTMYFFSGNSDLTYGEIIHIWHCSTKTWPIVLSVWGGGLDIVFINQDQWWLHSGGLSISHAIVSHVMLVDHLSLCPNPSDLFCTHNYFFTVTPLFHSYLWGFSN